MVGNVRLTAALAQRFAQVSLNPQPLPPRDSNIAFGDTVALNPQPLPPKERLGSLADRVALNPQPLPPRTLLSAFNRAFSGVSATSDAPASDRGIIVVGGRNVLPSALNQRGIIVVGG
ncbi:MAG TPA: hypothetical protein VN428_14810 [Bryobacteraceae bacterium]|nr:hypothetical protein [Bryobacteraceae bacterium]